MLTRTVAQEVAIKALHLMVGECFVCGSRDEPVTDVKAMSPDFRLCRPCWDKHKYNVTALRNEADRLTVVMTSPEWRKANREGNRKPICLCGDPIIWHGFGVPPLMCQRCTADWRTTCGLRSQGVRV